MYSPLSPLSQNYGNQASTPKSGLKCTGSARKRPVLAAAGHDTLRRTTLRRMSYAIHSDPDARADCKSPVNPRTGPGSGESPRASAAVPAPTTSGPETRDPWETQATQEVQQQQAEYSASSSPATTERPTRTATPTATSAPEHVRTPPTSLASKEACAAAALAAIGASVAAANASGTAWTAVAMAHVEAGRRSSSIAMFFTADGA